MTKKKVPRAQFVDCPFCGFPCTVNTPYSWCSGCYVEYYHSSEHVVFDTARKTPRFAWAKAIAKSGGMTMGRVVE